MDILRRGVKCETWLFGVLGFVTLFALLPWQPQGPFDARDWSLIEGVSVVMPWWQPLIEPLSAFGNIITGAPDFRLAAISLVLWVFVLSGGWVFLRDTHLAWWRRALWAATVALFAAWCVPALILLFSHLHFPGWRLEVSDPQWRVADLQSHTLGSHDALIRAGYNLRWHAQRGYDVVGITEHEDPRGSFYAEQLSAQEGGPLVIPSVEMVSEFGGFVLGMGLKPGQPLLMGRRSQQGYTRYFADNLRQDHQGALISLAWLLKAEDIEPLADAGVDAFELMNAGHPDIPDSVRNELLRLEREGRVRLVSSTDWHGWGGNSRTWTLLRLPGSRELPRQQQVDAVVRLLREGEREEVVPVVAGYQGEVSTLRVILSPLVESARYAAELSPDRLLGWWLWALVLWLLGQRLRAAALPPGEMLWSVTLLMVSGLLFWRGVVLYQIVPQGDVVLSDVTEELGEMAMQAALPLLLVGGWLGIRNLRRRGAVL